MTRKRVAPKQEMLQVRIHKNIRTRAELLLEWVAGNAELSPSGSAELTDVYRIAVSLGLERLESKRRRELNENPDPPEDQDEEFDPLQGVSEMESSRAVTRALLLAPEETAASMLRECDLLESKRRLELNENPDLPEEIVENPDPLEDEDEEVDPIQGLSAFQKQIYAEFIDKQKKVINIAPKGQPEKLIDAELARAVEKALNLQRGEG